jgi:ligand-binding sensor domain-containing protein
LRKFPLSILLAIVLAKASECIAVAQTSTESKSTSVPIFQVWRLSISDPPVFPPVINKSRDSAMRDQSGNVWMRTQGHGVVRISASGSEVRIFSATDGLESNLIESLFQDSQRRVWVGTCGRAVSYFAPQAREPTTVRTADETIIAPEFVHEDKHGSLWFGGFGGTTFRLVPGDSLLRPLEPRIDGLKTVIDAPWEDGVLALGRDSSIYYPPGGGTGQALKDLLPKEVLEQLTERVAEPKNTGSGKDSAPIFAMSAAQSRSGMLWIAFRRGLVFCQAGFQDCKLDENWVLSKEGEPLQIIESDDQVLFCLSTTGLFYRLPDHSEWTEVKTEQGSSLRGVYGSLQQSKGGLLVEIGNDTFRVESKRGPGTVAHAVDTDEFQSGIIRIREGQIELQEPNLSNWTKLGNLLGLLPGNAQEDPVSLTAEGGPGSSSVKAQTNYTVRTSDSSYSISFRLGWFGLDYTSGSWTRLGGHGALLHHSRFGTLWVEDEWSGLNGIPANNSAVWRPLGDLRRYHNPQTNPQTLAVFEDSQRRVWISTQAGLKQGDSKNRTSKDTDVGQGLGRITTIYESPRDARLWLGGEVGKVRVLSGTSHYDLPDHPSIAKFGVGSSNTEQLIVRSIQESNDDLWIALGGGVLAYKRSGSGYSPDEERSFVVDTPDIKAMQLDQKRRLWLLRGDSLSRYLSIGNYAIDPKTPLQRTIRQETIKGSASLPDENGAVWIQGSEGIGRQTWNEAGVPGRLEPIRFSDRTRSLGRIAKKGTNEWCLWRTRFTGMLYSTENIATPLPTDTAFPVSVMEPTADGRIWVGYYMNGLARWALNGRERIWRSVDGLPNATVLDISTVPGPGELRAWVATNDGLAFVEDSGAVSIPVRAAPGPVDVVLALPDGRAYAAFNPIPPELFLNPDAALIAARSKTHLRLIDRNGFVGEPIELPRGEILAMALDADHKTIWIGATTGLYALRGSVIERITADGRLGDLPIHAVSCAPDGSVWMAIDRQTADIPASIVGYKPRLKDIRFLTVESGLPSADRIDMLDFLPDGRLSLLAGGQLFRSVEPLFVRALFPLGLVLAIVVVATVLITLFLIRYRAQQLETRRHAELMAAAERFFQQIGRNTKRRDHRTLSLTDRVTVKGSPTQSTITVYCLPGRSIEIDQVKAVADQLSTPKPDSFILAYIFASHDLEPEARWRLDTYRLQHRKVIIPLTLAYTRRSLEKGVKDARDSLEALNRRYLAEQDLFDMRNALDEPRFFFGRKALVQELIQAIGRREHVAVIGQRKIGKTSFLNVLGQQLENFPFIGIDLQLYTREENWPPKLFRQILERYDEWGRAQYDDSWRPESKLGEEVNGTDFQFAIKERHRLRETLGSQEPLVIVLDEIERLFPRPKAVGGNAEEIWRYIEATGILRALGQYQGDRLLSLIVADRAKTFNRVNHFDIEGVDTNPFYSLFVEKFVLPLTELECVEMLKDIGHAMGIDVSEEAAKQIYRDSGGHPRLARLLASAASRQRGNSVYLGVSEYDSGLAWLREHDGGIDQFIRENIWRHVSTPERTVLARSDENSGAEISSLEIPGPAANWDKDPDMDMLILTAGTLREARQHLIATGLLEDVDGRYRCRVP